MQDKLGRDCRLEQVNSSKRSWYRDPWPSRESASQLLKQRVDTELGSSWKTEPWTRSAFSQGKSCPLPGLAAGVPHTPLQHSQSKGRTRRKGLWAAGGVGNRDRDSEAFHRGNALANEDWPLRPHPTFDPPSSLKSHTGQLGKRACWELANPRLPTPTGKTVKLFCYVST